MHIVIIGGSVNAVTLAAHIRREDEKSRLTILEKSAEIGIASCGIPSFLQGSITNLKDLNIAPPQLLQQVFNLNLLLNTEVISIDHKNRKLQLNNQRYLNYDRLVFATPLLHIRPDIKGILGDNIFTLHNSAAIQHANDYFWGFNAKRIIILGGGRQGIQTAISFTASKASVTIIEQSTQLLKYTDPEFSKLIEKILKKHNIKTITSTKILSFDAKYVTLSNQDKLLYDMAIIATNSRIDVQLPISTGIALGEHGNIIVNEQMQTNIKGIFACGECIEIKNSLSGQPFHIRNASLAAMSAKIAADNILGNTSVLRQAFNNELIPIFDYYMGVCGCNEAELQSAEISYRAVWLSTDMAENYILPSSNLKLKLLFSPNGRILGLQIFGKQGVFARLNTVAALINKAGSVQDLSEMFLSYTPNLVRTKDSLNILGSLALSIQLGDLRTIDFSNLKKGDILLNLGAYIAPQTYPCDIINIPFVKLRSQVTSLPKNQIIALYCRSGYSSYLAYCLLRAKGFDNIFLVNSHLNWE